MPSQSPPSKPLSNLVSKDLLPYVKPGAVFRVVDRITFPVSENLGTRTFKGSRWAIIVQEEALCRATALSTILVVPCSSGTRGGSRADLKVPLGEPGFTEPSWAFTSLVQPLIKGALEEHTGNLSDAFLAEVQDMIAALIPRQKLKSLLDAIPPEDEDEFPDENDMKKK